MKNLLVLVATGLVGTKSFRLKRIHMNIMDNFSNLFNSKQLSTRPTTSKVIPFIESASMSWEDTDSRLKMLETIEERQIFEGRMKGRGPSNHKANIRLFDAPEGFIPDVTLYRDTAGWCPYCEKVWLQLEEKHIPYLIEKVNMRCYGDKPSAFMRLNPSGGIPVANIKGRIIAESNDIMSALEKEYPNNKPLYPPSNSPQAARVSGLLKLERRVFGHWFNWLTSSSEQNAADEMDRLLKLVDGELAQTPGPYFLGDDISIVDIMFTPFLERMAASLPYYKGFQFRSTKYPYLLKWYEAMDSRETYKGIKSDYYTHCHDLPPQIGNCQFRLPDAIPYRDEIDGGAWSIVKPPSQLLEPMLPADASVAAREAVRSVLSNQVNLIRFALRAVGTKGSPRVSAPLADPNAVPNETYYPYIDSALRHIVTSLVRSSELPSAGDEIVSQYQILRDSLASELISSSTESSVTSTSTSSIDNKWPIAEVTTCLLYVRDRISVPRDMSVHAARLFRAHINLFIEVLNDA